MSMNGSASPAAPAAASAAAASSSPLVDFSAGLNSVALASDCASKLRALATSWHGLEESSCAQLVLLQVWALLQQFVLLHKNKIAPHLPLPVSLRASLKEHGMY